MKKLDLNALDAPRFAEWDGQSYLVRAITPRVASMIEAAGEVESVAGKLAAYYDAVALLIPSMPREKVDNLTLGQVQKLIEFASAEVGAVEEAAADPNGASSAPETVAELTAT